MITRDDLPPTPDWDLSTWLHQRNSEALTLPLLWPGDDG